MKYEVWGINKETGDNWLEGEYNSKEEAINKAKRSKKKDVHCNFEVIYDIDITIFKTK